MTDRINQLAFHASSVIINGKAAIFSGDGGIGKSTIANSLDKRGYEVPGDEVAYVTRGEDGIWRLSASMKKISLEDYTYKVLDKPAVIELIVLLRSHLDQGYRFEKCSTAVAVQESFGRLFCDRQGDSAYLPDVFRWSSSLFRQTKVLYLDFAKTVDFITDVETIIGGDK